MTRKYSEVIHAWADGADVQFKDSLGSWVTASRPDFNGLLEWRVRPDESCVETERRERIRVLKKEIKMLEQSK